MSEDGKVVVGCYLQLDKQPRQSGKTLPCTRLLMENERLKDENEQLRELLREMWTFTELVDVSMRLSNGDAWNAAGFERRMSELGVI